MLLKMTQKERFIKALKREPLTGLVPTFELVFFLTMEAFGKVHPLHRTYSQWNQMSRIEQKLQIDDMAQVYVDIAEKYDHSAILVHQPWGDNGQWFNEVKELLFSIREKSGDKYFLMMHGDPTYAMPDGDNMIEFSAQLFEHEDEMKQNAQNNVEYVKAFAEDMSKHKLLDGFALCSDYCFNTQPFFSPDMFTDFVAPYLAQICTAYREMGYYSIKHTDGNINPIVEQMVQCGPDALHSIDPQGGVVLKDIKAKYGDRVALIGNVNCGLLQTGTQEEADEDVRRSLREGLSDGGRGYIFATSNCVYTGLDIKRYERMQEIWRTEGVI